MLSGFVNKNSFCVKIKQVFGSPLYGYPFLSPFMNSFPLLPTSVLSHWAICFHCAPTPLVLVDLG